MPKLCVRLFGTFSACRNDQTLADLNACKVQELFSYLLLYRGRAHARESLAGLLWGDTSTTQSRKCLRQALWQLQTALDAQPARKNEQLLIVEADSVCLNSVADLWLDVGVFEEAYQLAHGIPGECLDAPLAQMLRQAVDLYQGDLLEGHYQDWCLYERERLQNIYLVLLDKLILYCIAQRQYETGVILGMRALRCDRAHERTHRHLMHLYYLAGDRAAALRQYQRCTSALWDELGAEPSDDTVALYEQIRADSVAPLPRGATNTPNAARSSFPQMLSSIKGLELGIANMQTEVHRLVEMLELAMRDKFMQ